MGRLVGQKSKFVKFERSSQLTVVKQESISETEEDKEVQIPAKYIETFDVYKDCIKRFVS